MTRAVAAGLVLAILLLCASTAVGGGGGQIGGGGPWDDDRLIADRLRLDHDGNWSLLTIPHLDGGEWGDGRDIQLKVALEGVQYDLVLEPHSIRAPGFRIMLCDGTGDLIEAPVPAPRTFRGSIEQVPQAKVAATVRNGQLNAMILLDGAMAGGEAAWYIQPLGPALGEEFNPPPDAHVVYRGADSLPDRHRCGGAIPVVPGPEGGPGGGGDGPDGPLICDIAIDADYAYHQQTGGSIGSTTEDVETIINGVSLIYEADVDVAFQISRLIIRTTNAPYVSGVMSSNLLNQFRNHWNEHHTSVERDIAHLFTGITTSDSNIIGLALLSVVCSQSSGYAYSRSRYTSNMSRRIGLHAHEIGHNFSVGHCNEGSSSCSPCAIMCSSIGGCGGDTSTLGCSTSTIRNYALGRACLSGGCTSPHITSHPQSRSVEAGQRVTFSVQASGPGSLSYRWQRNGTPLSNGGGISGATSSTLTIDPVSQSHAGSYSVVVTNPCGSVTSSSATLEVIACDPPQITQQPQSRTVPPGTRAIFSVSAEHSGSGGLSHQWRRDGSNLSNGSAISGATTATLTIDPVSSSHEGEYTCRIYSSCGAVVSEIAVLTVGQCESPAITSHPTSRSVVSGQAAVFAVEATGEVPLSYRWQRNGQPLSNGGAVSGATTSTLTIDPAAPQHAGEYRCVVTNDCGSIASASATLTVYVPPAITSQPASRSPCEGGRAVFSVTATGSAPLSYQWRRNGQTISPAPHISGINTPTLTIDPVQAGDAGSYSVRISNIAGEVVSQAAVLTVKPNVQITQQPTARTVPAGRRATLSVQAQGEGLSYQWQRNGQNLSTGGNPQRIFGANSSSITITPVLPSDAGEYRVRIEGPCGTVFTSAVQLTVTEATPSTLGYWRFEEGTRGQGGPGPFRNNDRAPSKVGPSDLDLLRAAGRPHYVTDTPGEEIRDVGPNRLAMRFDGGDALRTATGELLNFGAVNTPTGEFTIEMFAKIEPVPDNAATYRLVQKLEGAGAQQRGYDLFVWTGTGSGSPGIGKLSGIARDHAQSSTQSSTAPIDDGRWRHIAWRRFFDGQQARFQLWIDYELHAQAVGEAAGELKSEAQLWIGRGWNVGASDYLVGYLDEIRISDRPLLPSEFLQVSAGAGCYANCTGSTTEPILNILDFICFIEQFTEAQSLPFEQQVNHYANCDGSTSQPVLNIHDLICFIENYQAGCP